MSDEPEVEPETVKVFGLDVEPLEEGYIPLDAIVLIKTLDEDGDVGISIRHTDGLQVWDRVGIMTIALDIARRNGVNCWVPDDEEEDDDDGESA